MITLDEYPLSDFLALIPEESDRHLKKTIVVGNRTYYIKVATDRILTLKKSQVCACCDLKGTTVLIQDNTNGPHFNLYADSGVLMTADHIKPRSLDGASHHTNYQTLCANCNQLKSNMDIDAQQLRMLRTLYLQHLSMGKGKKKAKHLAKQEFAKLQKQKENRFSVEERIRE